MTYLRFFACLCLALGSSSLNAQERIDEINRVGAQSIKMTVRSADAKVTELAQRGFRMHGGFDVVAPSNADWVATFQNVGGGLRYRVVATGGSQVVADGRVPGDAVSALPAAMDQIVEKMTQQPGFFGGKLAFVAKPSGKTELYTADMFFQKVTPVTQLGAHLVSPRWSPDGGSLVFTSYARSGYPDIAKIDLANRSMTPVAHYKGVNLGARFSPDGRRLAFVSSSSGTPEVYISDANGGNARRYTWTRGLAATPTWSPDGRQIIFTSDDWGGPQIILLDLAAKKNTRIRTGMGGYNAEAAWNPKDRDQVAFTASVGGNFQVAVYRFSTGKSVQVTSGSGDALEPAWLADGRHLVYTARQGATKGLRIVDSRTGSSMSLHSPRLTSASQADFWSAR